MNAVVNLALETDGESMLMKMKESKSARAVQKAHFASFASTIPDHIKIFSFEGPDDRGIYFSWISKLADNLKYEAYQCNGKKLVLQLFDLLKEDKTGLGYRVYYFVDRDFDGLQGRKESERIFVTEKYSVENYVVCENVLNDVLNVTFHCHGAIELRQNIIKRFIEIYEKFLSSTAEINFRIYLARQYKINSENLPESLHGYLKVQLDGVETTGKTASEIINLEHEPTFDQIESARKEFKKLIPAEHYRGKFAVSFFSHWLGLLRRDRMLHDGVVFAGIPNPLNSINGNFSFQSLAPKARPPAKLADFLKMVSIDTESPAMMENGESKRLEVRHNQSAHATTGSEHSA